MTTMQTVAIVVLNWNNASDTLACLSSIIELDNFNGKAIVVDNGSTDNSVDHIRNQYPGTETIETGQNLGYAGGNNAGILRALEQGFRYVLILNNDVVVSSDSLSRLLDVARANQKAGVFAPLVSTTAYPKRVWSLGATIDEKKGMAIRQSFGALVQEARKMPPFEVDAVQGSAFLARRDVFEEVGLLDEEYFLYFEESDWSVRVREAGFHIVAVPDSIVWHKVSATLGQSSPVTDYYMARNQWRFVNRNWSGIARARILSRLFIRQLMAIGAYTVKSRGGDRTPSRNVRLLAMRDALLGRFGEMGSDVKAVCGIDQ